MNNWKYKLIITNKNNEQIIIQSPIRMECTISFGINQSSRTANFTLHNLSVSHRAELRYSPGLLIRNNFKTPIDVMSIVELYVAKDGQSYTRIFKGALLEAYSQQIGGTPGTTTHLVVNNLPIWTSISSHIFKAGTSKREAIKIILRDIPDVTLDNLGSIEGNFLTDTTCDGNALEQIQKICGSNAFVENDKISIIPTNESIEGYIDKITDDAVILGTPIVKGAYLTFKCLFIPELRFQQNLRVKSNLFTDFNGTYRVVGYTHSLIFSEEEGGTKTTDIHCYFCDESIYQDVVTTMGVTKDSDDYKTAVTTRGNNIVKGENVIPLSAEETGDVKRVFQHIQRNNGAIPPWKITANITWENMIGNGNYPSERMRELDIKKLSNCVSIAKQLQRFNDAKRISGWKVTSGWRSVRNNTKWHGETNSLHLDGRAIDFSVPNSRGIYYLNFHNIWNGGFGLSTKWYHIHVDNGVKKNVYRNG